MKTHIELGQARTGPLQGVRVADFSAIFSGPIAGAMLADQGADVIKVELFPTGDHARRSGLQAKNKNIKQCTQSTYFAQHNHSKRSIAINLKSEKGQSIIKQLVGQSDVLIENFAPGVIGRMGLSYDEVKAVNPEIIMC